MKKRFIVLTVVLLIAGLAIIEAFNTGLTVVKLGFIQHEKTKLENEGLAIEFPEKISVERLAVDGEKILGFDPVGNEVFRMNHAEFRTKAQFAFAQVGAWISKLPRQKETTEELFRVDDARGREGYAVIRDRRLTWVADSDKVLQQFDLIVIKTEGLLMFQWEPVEGGE